MIKLFNRSIFLIYHFLIICCLSFLINNKNITQNDNLNSNNNKLLLSSILPVSTNSETESKSTIADSFKSILNKFKSSPDNKNEGNNKLLDNKNTKNNGKINNELSDIKDKGKVNSKSKENEELFTKEHESFLLKLNSALSRLSSKAMDSVVSINTSKNMIIQDPILFLFYGSQGSQKTYKSAGLGSGVIVSEDGYIVTNHHVIDNVDEIFVKTSDGTEYEAEWVGSDPSVDIAVIKIMKLKNKPVPKFIPLLFGNSNNVKVGEMVLAIGNPFGLNETVTKGIISAKHRKISDGNNSYFQVDAVINPGNSGGPLINMKGEIIGINAAIYSTRNVRVWQGIGLAIPSNEAKQVYEAIVLGKPLMRGYVGVQLSDISGYQASVFNIKNGVLITHVMEDSPAEKFGLKAGDIILSLDGRKIKSSKAVLSRIRSKRFGEEIEFSILRKAKNKSIKVTVKDKQDDKVINIGNSLDKGGNSILSVIGISVSNLTKLNRYQLDLDKDDPGIVVNKVKPNSKFKKGDIIVKVNGKYIYNTNRFYEEIKNLKKENYVIIKVYRNKGFFYKPIDIKIIFS